MEFCFECHSSDGDLVICGICKSRSYHLSCLKSTSKRQREYAKLDYHKKNFESATGLKLREEEEENEELEDAEIDSQMCYACHLLKNNSEEEQDMSIEDVNVCLGYVINRVITWLKSNVAGVEEIKSKPKSNGYTRLQDLLVDILDLTHQIALDYGVNSMEHESSLQLFVDTMHEIKEIRICCDCYKLSNQKPKNWFVQICQKPHELVYAKTKTPKDPPWPAKVIQIVGNIYDVRFFGSPHSRSYIKKNQILPIEPEPKITQKSTALKNAIKEFNLHRKLLAAHHGINVNFDSDTESVQERRGRKRKKTETTTTTLEDLENKQRTRGDLAKIIQNLPAESPESAIAPTPSSSSTTASTDEGSERSMPVMSSNEVTPNSMQIRVQPSINSSSNASISPRRSFNREQNVGIMRLRRRLEDLTDIKEIKDAAAEVLAREIEIYQEKIAKITKANDELLAAVKKKQWCSNCSNELLLRYYCCWNNQYCSKECQSNAWQNHKSHCKRVKK